jgi:hypothetical protein
MRIQEIKETFLKWENVYEVYNIKVNDYPIYPFIRTEIYESLIFQTDLSDILEKTSSVLENGKISYTKILKSTISFFKKQHHLKNANLFVSNTDNKLNFEGHYIDNFYDKLIKEFFGNSSVLEFPNLKDYHFDKITNKEITVKADIFYVLERLVKKKIDMGALNRETVTFFEIYSKIFAEIHGIEPSNKAINLLVNRIKRNLQRIHLYDKFIKHYKPKRVFLKSAYSPMKQIFILVCKKYDIKVIELQHGHIYPFHIGYLLPKGKLTLGLFPDEILVWSNYYKEILENNNWESSKINVTGDFTHSHEIEQNYKFDDQLLKKREKYSKIITLISQHTLDQEFVKFLENIEKLPDDVLIFVKLHPRYITSQEKSFKSVTENNKNIVLVKKGNLKDFLRISDLVVGVYSTGIIEALEMGKEVHLINSKMSEFFNDLLEKGIVQKADDILFSHHLITNENKNRKEKFRCLFKGYFK